MSIIRIQLRHEILKTWMRLAGVNNTWLARQLRVTKGRVSQLLNSDMMPSSRVIGGLLLITKLPFDRLFMVVNGHPSATEEVAMVIADAHGQEVHDTLHSVTP